MASSDEEGELAPDCVTNYYLINDREEPVSLSVLPLLWDDQKLVERSINTKIFLRGTSDNGLQQVYRDVAAWKLELSYVHPEIYVLLDRGKTWIKLQRPRKSYEETVKMVLIAVRCLHFVKRNPHEESMEALHDHMKKIFSAYKVSPSDNAVLDQIMTICEEAASWDKDIAKSKCLAAFLAKMSGERKGLHEKAGAAKGLNFVVDADDDDEDDNADESDEDEDLFDHMCAFCDNGGQILWCEGRCMRSFHPTVHSGAESFCESLGYNDDQVEAIQTYLCKNCEYQQHQCFACGKLGSSDKSSGAESMKVFPCVSATCGHFYHPNCVSELLYPSNRTQAEELEKKIAAGESYMCPVHKCFVCTKGEDKKVHELQFAVCRRCPKSYHRKCLPRNITFGNDDDESVHQRAWDGLLPNRILIYCMDHKILPDIGTPRRNHLLFPYPVGRRNDHTSGVQSSNEKVFAEKRSLLYGTLTESSTVKGKKRIPDVWHAAKGGTSTQKIEKASPKQISSQKMGLNTNSSKGIHLSITQKYQKPFKTEKVHSPWRSEQSKPAPVMRPSAIESKMQSEFVKHKNVLATKPFIKKESNSCLSGVAELEKGVLELIKNSTSSFSSEEFIREQKMKCPQTYSTRYGVDKTITMGKVEHSVKAVQAALKKLDEGGTIEDAKAICEPEILNQIFRSKKKLSVYLAPFLHGMRYTSFGRHFTKKDKLKEVVERLRWYVQSGDTVVDFCCGSNDFSCLMREELNKMGKKCCFKNFDLIQPKNDFNFEKRDWMTVQESELPPGSNLIMGLNPPFGVQAALANKFINKALKFRPKLLILIVPKETERLDKKKLPYDLIWEDDEIFSGKSFYLPGSVNVHDQQMEQWNLNPPPLYLWSHPDWTARHKTIAQSCGHVKNDQIVDYPGIESMKPAVSNYLMEENLDCYGDFSNIMNEYHDINDILDDIPEVSDDTVYSPRIISNPDVQEEGLPKNDDQMLNDDMDIDMDLSTPANSPLNCLNLVNFEEHTTDGAYGMPSQPHRHKEAIHHFQPSPPEHQFGSEKGYAIYDSGVPCPTRKWCREN